MRAKIFSIRGDELVVEFHLKWVQLEPIYTP